MTESVFPEDWIHPWNWNGLLVSTLKAPSLSASAENTGNIPNQPAPILLIHGFGACKEHWRHNVEALRSNRDVYALDLIGFGASEKPRSSLHGEPLDSESLRYGIELWGQQVADFVSRQINRSVVLVGNSIGGVVALEAAYRLERAGEPAARVILIDCAQRALDDKFLAEQPPFRRWGRPLLKVLVRQRWLTSGLFRTLIRPSVIRAVLKQAYPSGSNVDDALVDILLKPALQPGAEESFRGFINLFNDKIAPELLAQLKTPVSMLWGTNDPWEPIGTARTWTQYPCVEELYELEGRGHCPHDEAPEEVNKLLDRILETQQK